MKTVTVDDQKRIQIPDAKPRQVFSYVNNGDGTLTLALVKAKASEPFPRGSLLKYFTPEKDKEELALLSGCSLEQIVRRIALHNAFALVKSANKTSLPP